MNKRGMSVFTLIILLTALTVGYVISINPSLDLESLTNVTVWPGVNINDTELHPELELALNEYINGLGYSYFAITRWMAEYVYNHPGTPYKLLLWGLIISIMIPIIVGLVKILVIAGILINEYIYNRRDKKFNRKEVKKDE